MRKTYVTSPWSVLVFSMVFTSAPDVSAGVSIPELKRITSPEPLFTPLRPPSKQKSAMASGGNYDDLLECMDQFDYADDWCHHGVVDPDLTNWHLRKSSTVWTGFIDYHARCWATKISTGTEIWWDYPHMNADCTWHYTHDLPSGEVPTLGRPECVDGSIILPDKRVVGEAIPIARTNLSLNYFTNRAQGHRASNRILVTWYTTEVPANAESLKVKIEYADRVFEQTFSPQLGFQYEFIWDGKNAAGQIVNGGVLAKLTVTETIAGRQIATSFDYLLGNWNVKRLGLGGWTMSNHHFYSKAHQRIYYGYGDSRAVEPRINSANQILIPSEDGSQVFVFNQSGEHLTTRQSLKGQIIYRFNYDSARRLTSIDDSVGNRTLIERNTSGLPTAIVAPYGQRTVLTVDSSGNLTSVRDPNGNSHVMTYISGGILKTFKRPAGQLTTLTYDGNANLVSDVNSSGASQTFSVQKESPLQFTMTSGQGTTREFRINASSSANSYTRNQGAGGIVSDYGVTASTDVKRDWSGLQTEMTMAEDARFGKQLSVPAETEFSTPANSIYRWGNTISRSTALDIFSTTSYSEVSGFEGRNWVKAFDATTRKWTVTSPEGYRSETTLDTLGRVVQSTVANFLPVQLTYDSRGNITKITQGGRTTQTVYNSAGLPERITNSLGQATNLAYDLGGRLISKTNAQGEQTLYAYNPNDNLTRITPAGRPKHDLKMNAFDLLGQYLPPPLTGVTKVSTEFAYNKEAKLTKITKPSGKIATFTYDPASGALKKYGTPDGDFFITQRPQTGLILSGSTPDDFESQTTYDAHLPTRIDYNFDSAGDGPTAHVALTYDTAARPTRIHVEGGQGATGLSDIDLAYDDDDELVQAGNETLVRNATTGLLAQTNFLGISTNWTYGTQYPEVSRIESRRGSTLLYRSNLTRDALGRITQKQETIDGITTTVFYEFDAAGRLVRVRTGSASGPVAAEYVFDANGNRTSVTRSSGTMLATYDDQDRILTHGSSNFVHSADGDRTQRTEGPTVSNYSYGFFGNLITATIGSKRIDYLSDAFNRRVARLPQGGTAQGWIYDNSGRIVGEINISGALTKRFVYASRGNVPDQILTSAGKYAVIADHLGSVRLVVNTATGAIAQRMDYDEFGRVTKDTKPGFQPFGFAGGIYDPDTKLVRFGARDYDSETGRWLSRDPMLFQGADTNLYQYVMADPVNLIDPSGLVFQRLIAKFLNPQQQAALGAASVAIGTAIASVGVRKVNLWALVVGGAIALEGGANLTHAVQVRGATNPFNDLLSRINPLPDAGASEIESVDEGQRACH